MGKFDRSPAASLFRSASLVIMSSALMHVARRLFLKHLVLFDIDGTLLLPDGAGRAAMRAALEQVYGTPGGVDAWSFAGSLDRVTVRDLMTAAGIAPVVIWEHFAEFCTAMEADLRRRVVARLHNIRPCPGGPALIAALAAHPDVLLGLVTGNFRASALVKLEAAGYDASIFRIGAYGDEAEDRSDLVPLAVGRASQLAGVSFHGPQVVMIGDTPGDIRCGVGIGARSIAVATGWTPRDELARHQPHYLFDDLSDTQTVLDAILAP